jgi:hypothetical protein
MSFIDLVADDNTIDLTNDGYKTSSSDEDDDDSESSDDSDLEQKFLRPSTTKKIMISRQKQKKKSGMGAGGTPPVETKSFKMYALSGKKGNVIGINTFKKYSDGALKRRTISGKLLNCDTKCFKKYTSKHIKFSNKLSSMGYKDTNVIMDEY